MNVRRINVIGEEDRLRKNHCNEEDNFEIK
jgi:hypothetical protein